MRPGEAPNDYNRPVFGKASRVMVFFGVCVCLLCFLFVAFRQSAFWLPGYTLGCQQTATYRQDLRRHQRRRSKTALLQRSYVETLLPPIFVGSFQLGGKNRQQYNKGSMAWGSTNKKRRQLTVFRVTDRLPLLWHWASRKQQRH